MQKKQAVIIGGGGHTRVLVGMLQAMGAPIKGIYTSDATLVGTTVFEVPVLGLEEKMDLNPDAIWLINGVGNRASREGAGLQPRTDLYQRYRARGFDFLPLVSNEAIIQPHVTMGEGVQLMPGVVVQPGAIIGENVIINTRASIDHDVVISPHAHIAPGVVLCGNVVVGEGSHIGASAVVIQGISVGARAVIGAGAVITQNVPDGAIVRPAMPSIVE